MQAALLFFNWFLILLPAVVYLDATRHRIGKIKGEKHIVNMHAGGWAAAIAIPVPFVPIIAMLAYLSHRRRLIEKAKEQPVTLGLGHKALVVIILLVSGLLFAFMRHQAPLHG